MRKEVTFVKCVGDIEQWQVTEIATAVKRLSRNATLKVKNGWATVTGFLKVNHDAERVLRDKYGFGVMDND